MVNAIWVVIVDNSRGYGPFNTVEEADTWNKSAGKRHTYGETTLVLPVIPVGVDGVPLELLGR